MLCMGGLKITDATVMNMQPQQIMLNFAHVCFVNSLQESSVVVSVFSVDPVVLSQCPVLSQCSVLNQWCCLNCQC